MIFNLFVDSERDRFRRQATWMISQFHGAGTVCDISGLSWRFDEFLKRMWLALQLIYKNAFDKSLFHWPFLFLSLYLLFTFYLAWWHSTEYLSFSTYSRLYIIHLVRKVDLLKHSCVFERIKLLYVQKKWGK